VIEKLAAKGLALIIALAVALLVGGLIGYKVSSLTHESKITSLESQLGAAKNAQKSADDLADRFSQYCGAIDKATQKQDDAIAELGRQADAFRTASQTAIEQARSDSAGLQRQAASIFASRPPPGVDGCIGARKAFNDELRAERAGAKP
jgi:hypothetical protein